MFQPRAVTQQRIWEGDTEPPEIPLYGLGTTLCSGLTALVSTSGPTPTHRPIEHLWCAQGSDMGRGAKEPEGLPPPTRVVYCSTFENRKGKPSRSSNPSKEPLDMAVIEQVPSVGFPLQWEIGKIKHPGREGSAVFILPSCQGCFVCQKGNYLGCCLIR